MGIIGIKDLKRSVLALVAVVPVSCGQITVQPTAADVQGSEGDLGTLSLTSEAFPGGAQTLVLNITRTDLVRPCGGAKPEVIGVPVAAQEGLGLSEVADSFYCIPHPIPPHHITRSALDSANKPDFGSQKIIKVKKGEEISPVQLRSGTYYAHASFYNAQSVLLYRGEKKFALAAGEKKSIKINLKKVDSGEVTIGFEVEKTLDGPTSLSISDEFELERRSLVGRRTITKKINFNGVVGVVAVSRLVHPQVTLDSESVEKIKLTKTQIKLIGEQLQLIKLGRSDVPGICIPPPEMIRIKVKMCKDCKLGEIYDFTNGGGCNGDGFHNLKASQFDDLWNIIHGEKQHS